MSLKRDSMGWPMLQRCCVWVPLRIGCILLCIISTLLCFANLIVGSWDLPRHKERYPEDNLISMSMVMFSTLSTISNLLALAGILLKRPGYLQVSLLFNSVFILCIFLVAIVTCLFSPQLKPFISNPGNIALVVVMLISGAAYSMYYLIIVNSLYRRMKIVYGDSAIPV